jgi:hypothetical protein
MNRPNTYMYRGCVSMPTTAVPVCMLEHASTTEQCWVTHTAPIHRMNSYMRACAHTHMHAYTCMLAQSMHT